MNTCWAECIGGCGGGLTKEHVVSKNQFKQETKNKLSLKINGFSFLKGKSIIENNFTVGNLCENHNNLLSELGIEETAEKFLAALYDISFKTKHQESSGILYGHVIGHTIDGNKLEKWFIKTVINIICVNARCCIAPFPKLTEYIFGNANLVSMNNIGLFTQNDFILRYKTDDSYVFNFPIIDYEKGAIPYCHVIYRGNSFLVSLTDDIDSHKISGFRRPENISFYSKKFNKLTGKIFFNWNKSIILTP